MMILGLVRNYIPSYQRVVKGGWKTSPTASRAPMTSRRMDVGTVAAEAASTPCGASQAAQALRHAICITMIGTALPRGG